MTNLEALRAECEPYTVSPAVAEKALADAGLVPEEDYDNAVLLAKAAVLALRKFLSLSNESEGGFTQGYSIEGLKQRITMLCRTAGLNPSGFVDSITVQDGSSRW